MLVRTKTSPEETNCIDKDDAKYQEKLYLFLKEMIKSAKQLVDMHIGKSNKILAAQKERIKDLFVKIMIFPDQKEYLLELKIIIQYLLTKNHSQKFRKDLLCTLSQNNQVKQLGRKSFLQEEIQRLPRSFAEDRERQLLKRLASQIYYALPTIENNKGKKVEVQIMHLECANKRNLFIIANEIEATKMLESLMAKFINEISHSHSGDNKEGKRRSKRYANRIKRLIDVDQKIKGNNPNDVEKAENIRSILKTVSKESKLLQPISLKYEKPKQNQNPPFTDDTKKSLKKYFNSDNQIFFITDHNRNAERHAEEFLADIFDYAKEHDVKHYSAIGGKKRPFTGCYGRLKTVGVNNYGKYKGRFFCTSSVQAHNSSVAQSAFALLEEPTYETLGSNNHSYPDQDTESESDSEFVAKRNK